MHDLRILIVGAGIGGLTSAVALRHQGFTVHLIEKEPEWKVYGVGIMQEGNVIRAMAQLGLVEGYLASGFGFNFAEFCGSDGKLMARVPAQQLDKRYPAILGVGRRALHRFLVHSATQAGATLRRGLTVNTIEETAAQVQVRFSDGTEDRYDIVIGADGLYSQTRRQIFPEAPAPQFVGQSVWRYNLPRPADLDCIRAYHAPIGIGLMPISDELMYMFVTTPEPGNPRYPVSGLAEVMRGKLAEAPEVIRELATKITEDAEVVYRPLERIFLDGPWHRGRVVLLGDAVHATTPQLGQGAGMAIEDSIVLAEELAARSTPDEAFEAFRGRRFARCKYICESSEAISDGQLGRRPPVDHAQAVRDMYQVTAMPI